MSERMILNEYLNELKRSEKELIEVLKQHYEQKGLDRPELEKEIDKVLTDICNGVWHSARCRELITDNERTEYKKLLLALIPDVEEARKQERIETGEYLEHCHLSPYETHRLISIHDIERLKGGQALKGAKNNDNKDLS